MIIETSGLVCYNASMKILNFVSVSLCRLSRFAIRKLGRGGTDLPGRIALKVNPNILREMSKGVKTIIVTGTNGKTTTSRMIEQCLKDSGKSYVANKSGANLFSGITADFAQNCTLTGKCKREYAVIECDEAAFKTVSLHTDPYCVVVTNVFSDQLDRYGDILSTLESIKIGCKNSKNAVLCLNADCSLTSSIAAEVENRCVFYGINCEVYKTRVQEISDAPNCLRCGHEYEYGHVTFGHLGSWSCPECGYRRPDPDVAVTSVLVSDTAHTSVEVNVSGETRQVNICLPGAYNIYNAAASIAVGHACGLEPSVVDAAMENFECGFGRMEKLDIPDTDIRMILIKNTAGCNQVLNFLTDMTEPSLFVIGLNDRVNDGRDISWIEDVNFECLAEMGDMLTGLYVTGIRADDMAARLKKAGIEDSKLKVFYEYDELIDAIVSADTPVNIMPNYTCMMDLRGRIAKRFNLKSFWE